VILVTALLIWGNSTAQEPDDLQSPHWIADLVDPEPGASAALEEVSLTSAAIHLAQVDIALPPPPPDAGTDSGEEAAQVGPQWSGNVQLGAIIRSGNTDSINLTISSEALRQSKGQELSLKGRYDYEESNREREENKVVLDAVHRRFTTDRSYWFARGVFRYDEMEKLDYRVTGIVGPGYMFANTKEKRMLLEGGVGPTIESYPGEDVETYMTGLLHWLWTTKVFDRSVFSQDITFAPYLSDFGRFLLISETSLTTPLSDKLDIRLTLRDEYDSAPEAAGVDENDMTFRATVVYTF
jgi:putative salt-induced outer membrane protein YdiY